MSDPKMFMIVATFAKAAGLSREEASKLWIRLSTREVPESVDHAYEILDESLQQIRRARSNKEW